MNLETVLPGVTKLIKGDTSDKKLTGSALRDSGQCEDGTVTETRLGNLFVITGPSGVGKGTLVEKLLSTVSGIRRSVSITTREMRSGEKDGVDYFFVTAEKFAEMKGCDHFLEWAEFAGNSYGTPREWVLKCLNEGCDVVLVIEVQGAKQIKSTFPSCVLIFLSPPSFEELECRLKRRNTESQEKIELRLRKAKQEMSERELFHYEVVNDDVEEAVNNLVHIVYAERCRIRAGRVSQGLP